MSSPALATIGINVGLSADPETMVKVAQITEEAGYESVWTTEHIVLPDPQPAKSPFAPELDFLESTVALSYLAACTSTIKLGTGIIVVPQREPAVLAKALASVDHLSNGRLIFGLGVGYLEPEMSACSTPMAGRGRRSDEYLAAMRTLWSTDSADFAGEFVSFSGVSANPKPEQQHVHTVIGGHSEAALRRTVTAANGWYGFNRTPSDAAEAIANLSRMADTVERPEHLGPIEVSVSPPPGPLTSADYNAYAEVGVDRLILNTFRHETADDLLQFIDNNQPANFT